MVYDNDLIWYDIFVNCNWVASRWQQYATYLKHKQYTERHETNNTLNNTKILRKTQQFWKSAGRAPTWRVIPRHLPYDWGKSSEIPQSLSLRVSPMRLLLHVFFMFLSLSTIKKTRTVPSCCCPTSTVAISPVCTPFLRAFAKLRKVTISFVMSVRPSSRMQQLTSHWKDFHEIWYLSIFRKAASVV
jgi:hypothetical protein